MDTGKDRWNQRCEKDVREWSQGTNKTTYEMVLYEYTVSGCALKHGLRMDAARELMWHSGRDSPRGVHIPASEGLGRQPLFYMTNGSFYEGWMTGLWPRMQELMQRLSWNFLGLEWGNEGEFCPSSLNILSFSLPVSVYALLFLSLVLELPVMSEKIVVIDSYWILYLCNIWSGVDVLYCRLYIQTFMRQSYTHTHTHQRLKWAFSWHRLEDSGTHE